MKLLFDQNLLHKLVQSLSQEFPGSSHVRNAGLSSADDLAIWEYAKKSGFIIVSKDNDFSQRSFLLGFPPKVVWLKVGNCSTRQIEEVLKLHYKEISEFGAELKSSLLVIDPQP